VTGISEILVLILLITGILIIPRMFKPAPQRTTAQKKVTPITAKMRAGIVVSALVPVLSALVLKPWKGDIILFLSIGLLPVALAWGLFWIFSAKKK